MYDNLVHLRQEKAAEIEAAKAILDAAESENRGLKPEEETVWNGHIQKVEDLQTRIERVERMVTMAGSESVSGRSPIIQITDNTAKKPFNCLGEQVKSVIEAAKAPYALDPRLMELRALGMNEAIGAEGGFLVQKDFQSEIFKRMYEVGQILPRCRKWPVGAGFNGIKIPAVDETSRATGSRYGGVRGYWINEGGTITASKPKFKIIDLTLEKLAALVYLTDELIADVTILDAFVREAASEEITFQTENALFNGDGAGKPLGLLNSPCLVSVSAESGQVTATVVYENVVKMWSRMWGRSRLNAAWFVEQSVEPQLQTMSLAIGTGGVPVYMPASGASGSPYATLMGRPIIPVEYCQTVGTVGDIIFADFSQYYVADKGAVQAAASIHVAFLTDEQVLRFIYRVDGEPAWKSALTPATGDANQTRSPFVALATR